MDLWRIERVEIRELDCSFSEPASATVTQLVADGEILADALEYTPVLLREAAEGQAPIGLFLDLPGHPQWSPLVRVAERVELALGDLVVSRWS